MSLYSWFWYHTEVWLHPKERRPYTYMIRDFYHKHPILTIFITMWAGYVFNRLCNVSWEVWLVLSLGVLLGHLFWGTKYEEGQQEYPEYMPRGKKK